MTKANSSTANTAPHSNNAALHSESPYQQRTTQRENPAQQLIKQAVEFLLQQLEAGKSETLTAYLAAMARFHNYSFGNILAIARQRPTATRVAGIRTWNELGRFVKRGEKGIQILAPIIGHRRRKDASEQEQDANSQAKPAPMLIGFRAVYVFDHSQTEGVDLPEFDHGVSGEVGAHRARLVTFLNTQNIKLEFNEKIAPALGVSYGGRIALLPGQSKAEEFATLVHETAHELLHKTERRTMTTATVRETESEMTNTMQSEYRNLPLDALTESPNNPRKHFDEASLNELAESIKAQGILAPLVVRPVDHHFEIVAGARRYRAAQRAGLETPPVRIVELTDAQALETSIVENLQRRDVQAACKRLPWMPTLQVLSCLSKFRAMRFSTEKFWAA